MRVSCGPCTNKINLLCKLAIRLAIDDMAVRCSRLLAILLSLLLEVEVVGQEFL